MIYCAQPTINVTDRKGTTTIQVPTFYLDSRVQGILDSQHAARIVADVCNPTKNHKIKVNSNVCAIGTMD